MTKTYDVIVFGATSFVGKILSRYLAQQPAGTLRWAMAGRSQTKLNELSRELAVDVPLLIADASDEASLKALCAQTRVIISTVGPYALYGEPLVRACVETGTDYCDLTGEIQWASQMIKRYGEAAKASGARIVHCCGFDSIPSDLGVHFLQQEAQASLGEPCNTVKMRVWKIRGGASGGTVASLMNAVKEAAADPAVRREMADPYAICPSDDFKRVRQPNVQGVKFDADFQRWVGPFVMATVNTRVVHRSHALQGHPWGEGFTYDEAMCTGVGVKGAVQAGVMAAGIAGVMVGSAFAPTRALLGKVLPSPGEGPSPSEQENGFYDLRFIGRTASGKQLSVKVFGDRDPGYGSTGKMLAQAAMCLAFDTPKVDFAGGFWTPASLFGERLISRLTAHAGLTFERTA
ncbi:MAG: saccharopine dehydrogenase NADP-binding domain-containing protein [Paraperlucidibaca sp.]